MTLHFSVEKIDNSWYVVDKIAPNADESLIAGPFSSSYLAQAELYKMLLSRGCSTGSCED